MTGLPVGVGTGTNRAALGEAEASHTARAAARRRAAGRAAGLVTGLLQVSIATSPFREDEPQYHPTWGLALPVPTADTVPLLRAARAALELIFRAGYRYQRAGVVLLDLSPAGALTGDLFAPVAPVGAARWTRLLAVLDDINGRWGRGTLRYLAEGGAGGQTWRLRRERLSPDYTTDGRSCRGWGEGRVWDPRKRRPGPPEVKPARGRPKGHKAPGVTGTRPRWPTGQGGQGN